MGISIGQLVYIKTDLKSTYRVDRIEGKKVFVSVQSDSGWRSIGWVRPVNILIK